MKGEIKDKFGVLAPLEQAERCLDIWLAEENRYLTPSQKQRVVGLMARYFMYEDEVTDKLMISFLRHYSGRGEIDMEDPTSVRMGIKDILDRAEVLPSHLYRWRNIAVSFVAVVLVLAGTGGWTLSHMTITEEQQNELKALTEQITALDHDVTRAAVWAEVKEPLGVKSYKDILWMDYYSSLKALEDRLNSLKQSRTAAARTGM